MKLRLCLALITASAFSATNWSDPATWGGTVPAPGSTVVIPHGQSVLADVAEINAASIELHGRLEIGRQDTNFTAGYIHAHGGEFVAGSLADPFANKLTITLTGTDRNAIPGMGGRALAVMGGGKLELIGAIPAHNWTMLAHNYTANIGDTIITLEVAPGWKVGDEIVITSTSIAYSETEKRTIAGITGNTVVLDAPLNFLHSAEIQQITHFVNGVPTTIDVRAEVGLLSHNIKIQGAADSEVDGFGGHVMVMDDASVALLQGVELYRMGQRGSIGRYPMHWHDVDDGGANSWMRFCSTHHSFNRGTTIHKTNSVTLSDNVIFDVDGHGVFLEDGKEVRNVFTHNLVALVHKNLLDAHWDPGSSLSRVLGAPGAFWITNPNNTFIDNAAAGTAQGGIGFWYDIYSIPRPGSISADVNYHPNEQPFGVFRGNRAHSNSQPVEGFRDGGWGFWMESITGFATLENFTTFANFGQVWTSGRDPDSPNKVAVTGARLSGNNALFNNNTLIDSLALGSGGLAMDGYDNAGRAEHSVFANFGYIFQLRFPAAEFIQNSTFINSPMVGNPGNFTLEEAESRFFRVANPEDSFGNGAPGMFTYSEILTVSGAKNAASGANGIAASDSLAWWTPGTIEDFIHFGFTPDIGRPYRVYIQPAGKTKTFVTTANLGSQRTYAHPDVSHSITFVGPVENETLQLNTWEGSAPGRALLLTLPAPSSAPVYSSVYFDVIQPVLQATSLAEFNASSGITVFKDATLLHVKLPTHLSTLTMAGYTISDAPPVNHDGDVDVYLYTLTSTPSTGNGPVTVVASIQVRNKVNVPQPGVTASFAWSGLVNETRSAVTNGSGSVTFSTKVKKSGIITGTVTDLSGVFDPAIYSEPLSRSLTVIR